jgi:hypothetical protein
MRRRFAPVVATGSVECRCGELIEPGSPWQLDQRDDGRGWLGPSHQRCNARAGWEKMVGQNGNGQLVDEVPTRWSRRWFEEPAVGTEVSLGDGQVEVHVGRGIWERVVA